MTHQLMSVQDLYEERIVLLGKLGLHETALKIYISVLNDFDSAER
jgi:hypothetical protein